MAARATMVDLIARTRLLIGDPSGGSAQFTDDNIQDFLDETRDDVRYEVLKPKPTFTTSGIQWNDYYSEHEHWEQGETLIWSNFATLTPVTPTISDRIIGHWGFANQLPPVLLAGQAYDLWNVAANLLEMRAAAQAFNLVNVSIDGRSMQLNQIAQSLLTLAKQYRARARPRVVRLVRDDIGGANMSERVAKYGPVSAGVPFLTGP